MTTLAETEQWEAGIRQLEVTDPVEGGETGIDNIAPRQLANRTKWLRAVIDEVVINSGLDPASIATAKLHAAIVAKYLSKVDAASTYVRLDQLGVQATDAEVSAAVAAHVVALDPHSQYAKVAEVAKYLSKVDAASTYVRLDQLGVQATDAEVSAAVVNHVAATDPHTQYAKAWDLALLASKLTNTANPLLGSALHGGNGYRKFSRYEGDPMPTIIQWGTTVTNRQSTSFTYADLVFPIAFPNSAAICLHMPYGVRWAPSNSNGVNFRDAMDKTGAILGIIGGSSTGVPVSNNLNWFAIGY